MARRGNGEGSIRKRKNGTWESRYYAGYNPKTGKLIRKSVYGKTRAEVRDKLMEKQEQIRAGSYCASDKLRVSEWLNIYLWEIKRAVLKPKTFTDYVDNFEKHIKPSAIVKMKMQDVRRVHLQSFIDDMKSIGCSAFTIHNVFAVLRGAFNEAEKKGLIPMSYAKSISLPKKNPKPIRILSKEEQLSFIKTASEHRLYAAFIVALTTGIRQGELTALKWSDYENESISITKNAVRTGEHNLETRKKTGSRIIIQNVPKTAAGVRTIPLLPIAIEALNRHRIKQNDEKMKKQIAYEDSDWMFCNEFGGIYDPKHFYTELQKVLSSHGLKRIKFHALRHTFASRGLEAEIGIKSMQELLGHETPEMVMHYQHLLGEQAKVEIDKLADVFK